MKNIKKQPDKKKKKDFECKACGQITETDEYKYEIYFDAGKKKYKATLICDCGLYVYNNQ